MLLAAPVSNAPAVGPPIERPEQLEFDPRTGQWREVEPPEPGTPEGDLALARSRLAHGDQRAARRAFKKWLKAHGVGHGLAREAELGSAETYLANRRYYKAHKILEPLAAEFGTDDTTIRVIELEFVIAEVFLSGTKRRWLGMRMLPAEELGIKILDGITANYPDTDLAEKALKTKADYYYRRGDFDLAEDEYARLISTFPRSQWLLQANLRRAQATLAQFPGTKFDGAALIESEERFSRFRNDFPQAVGVHDVDLVLEDIRNRRAQKEFEIGEYYMKVGKEKAGTFYYRSVIKRWPDTSASTRAQAALTALGLFEPPPIQTSERVEPAETPEPAGLTDD